MAKNKKIEVLSTKVSVQTHQKEDYISLTDIARYKDSERTDYIIMNWMRNRNTIEFLGIWEQLNNPAFNPIEFDGIKKQAGLNSFVLTAKNLATEITISNVREHDMQGETAITGEHVQNNTNVRNMLGERGIKPEEIGRASCRERV